MNVTWKTVRYFLASSGDIFYCKKSAYGRLIYLLHVASLRRSTIFVLVTAC